MVDDMPEDNLKFELKLKVGELTERGDFGRGIVRISAKDMKKINTNEGDVIEIESKRKTSAIAVRAYPADVGLDIIRMDGLVRKNCGAGISEVVRVRKADVKEAIFVRIAPARKGIVIHMAGDLLKRNLLMRPAMTGDIIIPNPVVQPRRDDAFEKFFFGIDTSDFFFTAFGEEKFLVVSTEPKGVVRITRATEVELLPQATEVAEEKAPDVTYEDLGGLHEEIKLVREMIELPLKHPELFESLGIEPPKGILLHGPPGTGKTLLAKAVANESGASFFLINGPEVMSKFYGESLTPDESIFTLENGIASVQPIGEVVKSQKAESVAEFDSSGKIEKGKIKSFIEHPFQKGKKIFEITTSTGRKIKVTDYHSLFALKDGKIADVKTSDISPNDTYLAIPSTLPAPETYYEIDILNELKDSEELNVRSSQAEEIIKKVGIQKSAEILKVKEKYVYDIYGKNVCISIRDFLSLAIESGIKIDCDKLDIVAKQNAGKLPAVIEIDEDMATVIGLFLAEGSYTTKDAIRITNSLEESKQVVRRFCDRYEIKLTEYQDDMLLNSKPLKILFEKILGIKTGAENKSVTPKLMSMPLNLVKAMLRGYFTGDGSVYPPKMAHTIEASTHSKKLANDIMYTLLYFGIVSKCSIKKEKYNGKSCYRILIQSPEGFAKFSKIGFLDNKRNERIQNYLKSKKFDKTQKIPIWPGLREIIKSRQRLHAWSKSKTIGKDILRGELAEIDPKKEKYAEIWHLIDSDIVWDRVRGMKEIKYSGNVYDVSVNPNENFVAGFGGIFAHNSEENLRKKFDEAEKNAPSILFIDEIDSIAPKREEVRGEVEKRVVSQLLTLLDGLKSRGKIIVIGATNIPNAIDPALRRPGRLDREIEIGVPTKEGRREILQIHTRGMPLAKDVDINKIAEITYGYVGADLNALCKEAAMRTLRRVLPDIGQIKKDGALPQDIRKNLIVTMDDFSHALKMVEPSAMREVMIEVPNVKWDQIGGLENVKGALIEVIEWPLKNPEVFVRLGMRPPRGILLFGPPGCGKTLLAKAVANESQANFIYIKASDLLSMWVGESERHVRDVFRRAKQVAPSIVFFDEIDSLVPRRGSATDSHVTERVVSQLLAEISGLEELHGVVVIAATNRPDIIDPALLRPGRFDRQILVPTPDEKSRLEILRIHTKSMPLTGVDLEMLAKGTEGFSGADLEALAREAAMNALRKDMKADKITKRDFDKALKEIKPSVSEDMNKFYEAVMKKRKQEKIEEEVSYTG
jgi:SpoVK/Ycf46/Vps4 family AAA+-type ATPase